jgi:glutathione S-transferase
MISTPNLYVAKCCPYSYQILYLLYDLGIADLYNITFYRYWDQDDAKSTIVKAITPDARPPALTSHNLEIAGVYAILNYLFKHNPNIEADYFHSDDLNYHLRVWQQTQWWQTRFYYDVVEFYLTDRLLPALSNKFSPDINTIRLAQRNLIAHLQYLDANLTDWLCGDHFSYADISLAMMIACLDYINVVPWRQLPQLHTWYSVIKSKPAMQKILAIKFSGFEPAGHYTNPDF